MRSIWPDGAFWYSQGLGLEMQEPADRVFETLHLHCPELTSLVLNARSLHQDCSDLPKFAQFGYLRVIKTDLYGRVKAAAAPIELHLIKYHVPCYGIYDDDIQLGRVD